jgi:hypothetical protein
MANHDVRELIERIRKLPPAAQLYVMASVAGNIQRDHFPPSAEEIAAREKAADEWAAHYNAVEGWKTPYPLTEEELALIPDPDVRCQDAPCDVAKSTL